jgi:hypothetical protein
MGEKEDEEEEEDRRMPAARGPRWMRASRQNEKQE